MCSFYLIDLHHPNKEILDILWSKRRCWRGSMGQMPSSWRCKHLLNSFPLYLPSQVKPTCVVAYASHLDFFSLNWLSSFCLVVLSSTFVMYFFVSGSYLREYFNDLVFFSTSVTTFRWNLKIHFCLIRLNSKERHSLTKYWKYLCLDIFILSFVSRLNNILLA